MRPNCLQVVPLGNYGRRPAWPLEASIWATTGWRVDMEDGGRDGMSPVDNRGAHVKNIFRASNGRKPTRSRNLSSFCNWPILSLVAPIHPIYATGPPPPSSPTDPSLSTMQQYAQAPQTRFYPMQHTQYPTSADYVPAPEQAHTVPDGYSSTFGYEVSWPCYYSYADPDYATWAASNPNYEVASAELPLYAPVPVNGPAYPSVLSDANDASGASYPPSYSGSESDADIADSKPTEPTEENPLDVYLDAPQVLFPTPSELLTDLNTRSEVSARAETQPAKKSPASSSSTSSSSSALGKRKREAREKPENLNQRKAYFRSVSENVGFTITDPDTITSHDKKRSYLECLEEYVQWLHEQIRLVGHEPVPLERISTYRGLKNSSLRTMLVHMQNTIRNRNAQKLQAEKRFMDLQNALLMRAAAEESLQFRRHSIAMGSAIPSNITPNFA